MEEGQSIHTSRRGVSELPFKSKKQEVYLRLNEPEVYQDWKDKYGSFKESESFAAQTKCNECGSIAWDEGVNSQGFQSWVCSNEECQNWWTDEFAAEEFAAYVSTDTTRRVRGELKRAFPNMKFSVSKKDGSLRVAIMKGDLDFRDLWEDIPYDKQYWRRWNDPKPHFDGYVDINTYHTDSYNPKYTSVFNEIVDIMKGEEWFDKSDARIDYFHTAYYLNLTIGKRDRDYIYTGVPRMSDLFRRAETFEARDCVDIVSNFVEPSRNYYRVRFRNPKIFVGGKYTTPQWGQRAAMTIGKKYYGVSGCKITMAQPMGGRWVIQSVLIPKQAGVEMDKELALKIANHIQDRIEREGKWASVICRDRGSTRYVSRINNQHIVRDEGGRFAPHAAEEFGADENPTKQEIMTYLLNNCEDDAYVAQSSSIVTEETWTLPDLFIRQYLNNGCDGFGMVNVEEVYLYLCEHKDLLIEYNMVNRDGYNNFGFPLWKNYDYEKYRDRMDLGAEEFGAEGYIDDGLIWEMRDRLEPPAQGYVMFASSSPEVNIPYLLDKGYDRDEIIIVEYGGNETIWIPNTPPLKRAKEFGANGR